MVEAFEEIKDPGYLRLIEAIEKWLKKYAGWKVENGCIYKHRTNLLSDPMEDGASGWKLVVPDEFKERVLREAHCPPSSGHMGLEKTADRIGREYYWPITCGLVSCARGIRSHSRPR